MGKPKNQGVSHIKPVRSLRSIAEGRVGKRYPTLRVLNSYWVNQVKLEISVFLSKLF
jgi:large subunit ribosomal protein L15e